jgi:hypothetical protein
MKMKTHWLITIALLTSLMGGCAIFQGEEEVNVEPPPTGEIVQPPAEETPPVATEPPPFEKPTQPGVTTLATLTPATDPDSRVRVVPTGTSNPFILVPKPQKITVDPDVVLQQQKVENPVPSVNPVPNNNTPQAGGGAATSPKPNTNGGLAGAITPPPSGIPTLPNPGLNTNLPPLVFRPELPPLPEPSLARAVQVTGMVTIGSETQIILKAPNEPFSRYVKAGQYISDGQVLVKRIEGRDRGTPVIILEQFGIEVSKRVEAPTGTATSETVPSPPAPPPV